MNHLYLRLARAPGDASATALRLSLACSLRVCSLDVAPPSPDRPTMRRSLHSLHTFQGRSPAHAGGDCRRACRPQCHAPAPSGLRLYVSFCISYGCEMAVAPSSLQHHQPCIYIDRQVDVQPPQRCRSTSSNRSCRHTPWLRSSRGHLTSVYVYVHNHINTYM